VQNTSPRDRATDAADVFVSKHAVFTLDESAPTVDSRIAKLSYELRTRMGRFPKGSEMLQPSAILFAMLVVWGSMSPVFACRSENNATIVKPSIGTLVRTGIDQYNAKVDPNSFAEFDLVAGPSRASGFCASLSILESSDLQNTTTGVTFWGAADDLSNDNYFLFIRNDQYQIVHQLFGKEYELVPWTTDASIKKGLRQKNEVDVRVTATGADIQINGTELTPIVARPSTNAQRYGVIFMVNKTAPSLFLFQLESPRIVK
jgi:hypothetical protein